MTESARRWMDHFSRVCVDVDRDDEDVALWEEGVLDPAGTGDTVMGNTTFAQAVPLPTFTHSVVGGQQFPSPQSTGTRAGHDPPARLR